MPRKSSILVSGFMALATVLIPVSDALAYNPGTAAGRGPSYKVARGGYEWGCGYAGWRSNAKVIWKCELVMRSMNDDGFISEGLVKRYEGSWTPGSTSYTTATWFKPKNVGDGQYCVKAYAYSVDGGTGWKYKCA